jgi:hypothetical protein
MGRRRLAANMLGDVARLGVERMVRTARIMGSGETRLVNRNHRGRAADIGISPGVVLMGLY